VLLRDRKDDPWRRLLARIIHEDAHQKPQPTGYRRSLDVCRRSLNVCRHFANAGVLDDPQRGRLSAIE
jgi:hypothetical protein